jgi:hypothetical protein
MAGKHDVKETKEAILALVVLGAFVADRLKDGVQLDDAMALGGKLASDPEFKAKVMAGIDGMDKVPDEVSEIDLQDLIELAKVIPDVLAAMKVA